MNGSTATSAALRNERIYGYVSCIQGWMALRLQGTCTLHINTGTHCTSTQYTLHINTGTHCTSTQVHTAHQQRYTLHINTGTHCTSTQVLSAHQHRYTLHINTGDSVSRPASFVNLIICLFKYTPLWLQTLENDNNSKLLVKGEGKGGGGGATERTVIIYPN